MKIPLGLTIALGGIVIVAAMGFGGWWWWNENAEQLTESAKGAYLEGQRAGSALDEPGCLAGAFAKHGDKENQTLLGTIRTSLFLRGCLDTSKPDPKFCAGVPPKDEVLALAAWSAQRCANQDLTDSYCGHLMAQVSEYCSSNTRTAKL